MLNKIKAFFGCFETIEQMAQTEWKRARNHPDEVKVLRDIPHEDGMICFHTFVGLGIRNRYNLWNRRNPLTRQWFLDQGTGKYIVAGVDQHPCHPDAISMLVLKRVWQLANDR